MSEVQRLAALVAKLDQRLAGVERERRLSHASMEGGAVNVYQPGTRGRPGVALGQQYDGTYAPVPLGGPAPPAPSAPSAIGGVERLLVRWDGTFAAGTMTVAPQDWSRAEVHVSTSATPGVTFDTLKGTIESPRGGEISVAGLTPDVDYWVWLVARSQSGKFSAPSAVAGPVQVTRLGVEDIDLSGIGGNTIYRGDTEPAAPADGHRIGDLWLQTPGNVAYRWEGDPGAWVQVENTRISQALQDAFTAQQSADQAAADALVAQGAAGTAQTAADNAATAALAAQNAADQAVADAADAQATADGKVRTFFQTTAPTGMVAGDVGDLWFDTDDGNRMYRWSGTAWVVSDDQRIAAAVTAAGNAQSTANTKIVTYYQNDPPSTTGRTAGDLWVDTNDGNKLYRYPGTGTTWTAVPFGAGAISATARQLGAITTYRQASAPTSGMIVGDFWIRSADNLVHRYEGATPTWVAVQDVAIQTAITNAATAQAVADGKMRIFTQASAPTGLTATDVGDMWIETDAANRVWTWDGDSWEPRLFGNAAIQPASLVARDVIATGTVSAALLESILVLATTIIAGDPNGTHARMTPTGFRVFRPDANGDGMPDEVVRLGTDTDDNFAIVRADGSLAASIDSAGAVSATALTVGSWPNVAAPDHTGRGGLLLDVLDRRPRGLVGWGSDTGIYEANTTAGRGIFDVTARLYYGRMYKITVKCRVNGTVANDALAEVQVRWTESDQGSNLYTPPPPAAPTINSPVAGRYQASTARPEAQGVTFSKPFSYGSGLPDSYRDVRFLLCLARPVGSTTISMYGAGDDITELIVEDVGPFLQPTKTVNDGGGTVTNPGPAPAPQTQRYTRTWAGTWHQNWLPSGAPIDLPGASQGRDPSNGNMRSYLGFSGVATDGSGLGMDHIIGSQIESVWLYLYSWHWYYDDGGPAIIGMHGFRDPAPGFGGGDEWMVGGVWFGKPGFNWVDLGPAGFGNWASGTWKGIMLGSTLAGADSLRNYARFTDETDPNNKPVITVTYRR